MGTICLVLAVLVPSILAGIRADNVGTDILIYGKKIMVEAAKASSFSEMNQFDTTYTEYGYRFFAFVVSRFFYDTGWLLFFTQVVNMGCFVRAIYLMKNKISMTKSMALYLFIFYHVSFNIMRQSMATSMILLAFCYLTEKKYKRYALITVLAFYIHSFSILISAVVFLLYILEFCYRKKWQKTFAVIGISVSILLIQYMLPLLYSFFGSGLERYARYLQDGVEGGSVFSVLLFITFLVKLLLFFFTYL